jgi:hypothetical protein
MTPKEKAEDLVNKYKFTEIPNYTSMLEVKQCALIAVDEILLNEENKHSVLSKIYDYWEEVKQEIEKL